MWESVRGYAVKFMETHGNLWVPLAKGAAAVAGALVLWLVLRRVAAAFRRRAGSSRFFAVDDRGLDALNRILTLALALVTGMYLIEVSGLDSLKNVFYALMVVLAAFPANAVGHTAIEFARREIAGRTAGKLDDIVFDILGRFSGVLVYGAALLLALDFLGVNVLPFVAGAGVVGIAVGFAAQDTLSNLIAGLLLLIDRPFEVGDRIEVWAAPKNSATWGDVVEIGLRATKIRTTDNIVIVIPNNEIMKRDIVNYTHNDSAIRVRVPIGIAYDADIAKAKEIILRVAGEADWILKEPAPVVEVVNFGESSVDLQARVWIEDARRRIKTISHVTDHVKAGFDAAGIEIPFPQRVVTVRRAAAPKKTEPRDARTPAAEPGTAPADETRG